MSVKFAILLASTAPAFAQHDHAHEEHHPGPADTSVLATGVALVAATFDTMLYAGDYQGIVPNARWSNARFAAVANVGVYRVEKNGAAAFGLGDLGVHAQALLVRRRDLEAGVLAGISLPTGNSPKGMGMGHLMLMPGVFVGMALGRVRLAASVGYSRALGGDREHDHGAWPLVSPMLMSEVSWTAGSDVRVSPSITAGARASGGLPAGEGGRARSIVGARVGWRSGRAESAFELQAGLVGDPFNVRGVVSTMLNF